MVHIPNVNSAISPLRGNWCKEMLPVGWAGEVATA